MLTACAVSSLCKVLPGGDGRDMTKISRLSGFRGEGLSFQIAFRADAPRRQEAKIEVECGVPHRIRRVICVPVTLAAYPDADEDYIGKAPGLYPDLLRDLTGHDLYAYPDMWQCVWVDLTPDGNCAGEYEVRWRVLAGDDRAEGTIALRVYAAQLPEMKIIHCRWLHTDCLAQAYGVGVFSEEYWRITEDFVTLAAKRGVNAAFTPIHTPPLDTREGGERPTVQLVRVKKTADGYAFDTSPLRRWIAMCKRAGMRWFEMAHLYTQWGARHAPKIVAEDENGREKRIFSWETDACSEEYRAFLAAYIPAVRAALREEGVEERAIWHISDEPSAEHAKNYRAAFEQVKDLLSGCRIVDAMSSYELYAQGYVKGPVVAVNHIEPFIENGVEPLWAYFCCGQYRDVPNQFIAMPSYRLRVLAPLLFRYGIKGFLQWGYNFYNSAYSDYAVDPYAVTDGDGWVPAGDPFLVYPGKGGVPEESIRLMVTGQAMQDLRAMELLEELKGRESVCALIDEAAGGKPAFTGYPRRAAFPEELREKIDRAILEKIGG